METKEKHINNWAKIQKEIKDEKILAQEIMSIKLDRNELINLFNFEKNERPKKI